MRILIIVRIVLIVIIEIVGIVETIIISSPKILPGPPFSGNIPGKQGNKSKKDIPGEQVKLSILKGISR